MVAKIIIYLYVRVSRTKMSIGIVSLQLSPVQYPPKLNILSPTHTAAWLTLRGPPSICTVHFILGQSTSRLFGLQKNLMTNFEIFLTRFNLRKKSNFTALFFSIIDISTLCSISYAISIEGHTQFSSHFLKYFGSSIISSMILFLNQESMSLS